MILAIVSLSLIAKVTSEIPSIVVESHEHLTLHQTLLVGVKQDDDLLNADSRRSRHHVCGGDIHARFPTHMTVVDASGSTLSTVSSAWKYSQTAANAIILHFNSVIAVDSIQLHGIHGAFRISYKIVESENDWRPWRSESGERFTISMCPSPSGRYHESQEELCERHLESTMMATVIRLEVIGVNDFMQNDVRLTPVVKGCMIDTPSYTFLPPLSTATVHDVSSMTQTLKLDRFECQLQFMLFADKPDGVIMSMATQDNDVLLVQLEGQILYIYYSLGSTQLSVQSAPISMLDSKWHFIEWRHSFNITTLSVDGVVYNSTVESIDSFHVMEVKAPIYIGSNILSTHHLLAPYHSYSNLTGTLSMFRLDGMDLLQPITTQKSFVLKNDDLTTKTKSHVFSLTATTAFLERRFQMPRGDSTLIAPITLQFGVKTFTQNGTILVIPLSHGGLVQISTVRGQMHLTVYGLPASTKEMGLNEKKVVLADMLWHSIVVEFTKAHRHLSVSIDNKIYATITTTHFDEILPVQKVVRFGARETTSRDSIIGCIRDVIYDGMPVTFDDHNLADKVSDVVYDSCTVATNLCHPSPCSASSTCTPTATSYKCHCPASMSGAECRMNSKARSCETQDMFKNMQQNLLMNNGKSIQAECTKIADEFGALTTTATVLHPSYDSIEVSPSSMTPITYTNDVYLSWRSISQFVAHFFECRQTITYPCDIRVTVSNRHMQAMKNVQNVTVVECLDGRTTVEFISAQQLPISGVSVAGKGKEEQEVNVGAVFCSGHDSHNQIFILSEDAKLPFVQQQTHKTVQLSLQFRTSQQSAMLLSNQVDDESFKLYIKDSHTITIQWITNRLLYSMTSSCDIRLTDNEWHIVDVVISQAQHSIRVDFDDEFCKTDINKGQSTEMLMPNVGPTWIIGASNEVSSAFIGEVRALYVNEELVDLHKIAQNIEGIHVGFLPDCQACENGGICIQQHDGYKCDCTNIAFGGQFCENDVGYTFTKDSSLQYEAQSTSWTDLSIRLGFSTNSLNSRVLRGDNFGKQRCTLNIEIDENGHIVVTIETEHSNMILIDDRRSYADGTFYQITLTQTVLPSQLTLLVDGYPLLRLHLNDDFFNLSSLTYWKIGSPTFSGCFSQLAVGSAHPLKMLMFHEDGVEVSGELKNSMCTLSTVLRDSIPTFTWPHSQDYGIDMDSIRVIDGPLTIEAVTPPRGEHLIIVASSILLSVLLLLICSLCCICARRYCRPNGTYKTHEGDHREYLGNEHSQVALVPQVNRVQVTSTTYIAKQSPKLCVAKHVVPPQNFRRPIAPPSIPQSTPSLCAEQTTLKPSSNTASEHSPHTSTTADGARSSDEEDREFFI